MSLLIPGLGQVYNKEPLWKPSLFIATEIVSITSIFYANKKADEIRDQLDQNNVILEDIDGKTIWRVKK